VAIMENDDGMLAADGLVVVTVVALVVIVVVAVLIVQRAHSPLSQERMIRQTAEPLFRVNV
jgi:Tfp pilus assembly protein PilX